MKYLFAALLLAASPAFAADAPPPPPAAPAPEKTTSVQMSITDLQVTIIAVANAGGACDQGVAAICQIVPARAATLAKLQAAFQTMQAPPATAKK